MWTTLKFRGRGKTKKTARDIYKRTLDIEFERDRSISLGSTIGDGQTDRQTERQTDRPTDRQTDRHTHTDIFSKTCLDCGSDVESEIIKKIEVEFFDDCNRLLPSLLTSRRVVRK